MRNLRTVKVVYWVNVSESSGTGGRPVFHVVPYKGPLNCCCCCCCCCSCLQLDLLTY